MRLARAGADHDVMQGACLGAVVVLACLDMAFDLLIIRHLSDLLFVIIMDPAV